MKVGVLALQGAFARHASVLRGVGAAPVEVKTPEQLTGIDALILPGGESTTMSLLLDRTGLREPLAERLASGIPVLGTCAGMILLATEVLDGRPDQRSFGVLDLAVRRNGFGRQIDSFEADLDVSPAAGLEEPARPLRAVFIRAPLVERVGPGVQVLAGVDDRPVFVRSSDRAVWATAFHPELTDDARIHRRFLKEI